MKKHRKEKSIITQTASLVSLVFAAALLVLTAAFSVFFGNYMKKNIIANKREQAETIARTIGADLDAMTDPLMSLGAYRPTVQILRDSNERYSKEWMENIRSLDAYLTNVNLFNQSVVDVLLINLSSEVVYCMNDILKVNYDYPAQKWFEDALMQESIVRYAAHRAPEYQSRSDKEYTVSMIYPVSYKGDPIGYILLEYDLVAWAGFFRRPSDAKEGYYLLDEQGNCVFDYLEEDETRTDRGALYNVWKAENQADFQYDQNHYLMCEVAASGWYVVSETANSIIVRPIQQLLIVVALIILATVGSLMLLTVYLMKKIRRPMDVLVDRIGKFDGSTLPEKYDDTKAPKELSVIGRKFDEMASHTNKLIQEVYVAQLSRKEMELEAMVNQINPHFLYNVFQLIQTEAVIADNTAIEEMIQALSNMMRYTMERKREKVAIREELAYMRDYLMFYKERFPELFEYTVDCEEGIEEYESIKFILQPVLENCFKHGFKRMRNGGRIAIQVYTEGLDILFRIRDNGSGIAPDRLQEIREGLAGKTDGSGIGVMNTNARLKLVYGPSYGIWFESVQDQYTEVSIRIKAEKSYV